MNGYKFIEHLPNGNSTSRLVVAKNMYEACDTFCKHKQKIMHSWIGQPPTKLVYINLARVALIESSTLEDYCFELWDINKPEKISNVVFYSVNSSDGVFLLGTKSND